MNKCLHDEKNGIFLKRKDIAKPKIKDLLQALYIQIFEIEIILQSIKSLKENKLYLFDSHVGDRKCQTRTSMIMDLLRKKDVIIQGLMQEQLMLKKKSFESNLLLQKINKGDYLIVKKIDQELRQCSLSQYLRNAQLCFIPSESLTLISLCFFTSMSKKQLDDLKNHNISMCKINKFLVNAKIRLCGLSIQYEQRLASQYGFHVEEAVLQQIQYKGFCFMTPFFPSFTVILKKMKKRKQALLLKVVYFCKCGGEKNIVHRLFRPEGEQFVEDTKYAKNSDEVVMVIEAGQYVGSYANLKQSLNFGDDISLISSKPCKLCTCHSFTKQNDIGDVEEAILANFAQHAQFTNNAEIDFEAHGFQDSEFKREYDYLITLPGYSIDDMSKLFLNHIYANTIAEEFEQQEDSDE